MQVPFNAPGRGVAEQEDEILEAVRGVMRSGHYVFGPSVARFEAELTEFHGRPAVTCNSCTDALTLGLKLLDVGPGDEVITVSHTAIPTITAIRATGAAPVFADVDPGTWLIDPRSARSLITPRTKAIVPVHLYGNVAPVDELLDTRIPVFEDVAQAMGSRRHGRIAGTLGRMGALSFYPTKNLGAIGDGGALLLEEEHEAVARARMLRNYGQRDRYNAVVDRGMNSRLDELQAAILSVRMRRFEAWRQERNRLVERYREGLAGLPLGFQHVLPGAEPAWHLAVIALESESVRDRLQAQLAGSGVGALIHYPLPTHQQEAFARFSPHPLPVTENLARRILSLPMYPGLLADEQGHVIASLRRFFG